jgi:hypothetical protein
LTDEHEDLSLARRDSTRRDVDTGLAFTSTNVTSFIIDGNTATFQGTGLANGVAVSYTVQVVDGRRSRSRTATPRQGS